MTSWLTATWLVVLSACFTLAVIHARVWLADRTAFGNAAFALLAVVVALMGGLEQAMLHTRSPDLYGRLLWCFHFPALVGTAAIVWFFLAHLRAGSRTLAFVALGLRAASLVANVFTGANVNFREVRAIDTVNVLGDVLSVPVGVPNPWMVLTQASMVCLVLFVALAARTLWSRGEHRRAALFGGGIGLLVAVALGSSAASFWGFVKMPLVVAPFFIPVLVAMGWELSVDLVRASRLVAELDQRTAQLEASRQQAQLASDASNSGLWRVDVATGRLWATPRMLAMLGLAPDREHTVEDALQRVHPEDRERIRAIMTDRSLAGERAWLEYRAWGADGSERRFSAVGRRHGDGKRVPYAFMGASIDVTDRRRAEDERAEQRAALEHLSRVATLAEMSAALAHEINQPLAVVLANAEAAQQLLTQPEPDLDELRAILDDIVAADERAGEVIRRLRTLLTRGLPKRQPESLADIVRGALELMRADLERAGVTVELQLDPSPPAVEVDRITIEQVLINLLGNARDAMADNPPGDRVVRIESQRDGRSVELRIIDRGHGLPSSPDRVFTPFFTTKAAGLGMGLAISRSIVLAHGGRLAAVANAGRGATFVISLPCPPAAPTVEAANGGAAPADQAVTTS